MLPSESGAAPGPSSWASGVFDAARDAVGDVVTELSSFTKFRKRVDDLIRDLKGSAAGPGEVGQEQLVRHQFGGGAGAWTEASGLFTSYETVITELESLSKLLSDSMEGMNIAVLAAHKGYQNIDLDIRDRMQAISAETTKHYGGSYDPALPKKTHEGGTGSKPAQTPSGGDSGGTI
ncbi:hypothetical protein OHB41_27630 [Streptomyces sp. NBC_01571]|uniref:hypothetical protein n=1 Tax=Streptomyces sp. NBC_01571 TaxID=2975883 RepID=UPI002253573C|nr:hypothetical protein [Streptomyces sp. NBC_01571]MCX4576875.1 hypothetical protein [Streptomyces sp. NBC_01571]